MRKQAMGRGGKQIQNSIKRIFDILFSCIGLVLFFPIGLFIAGLVKLTSPGPVFFFAEKAGVSQNRF